MGGSIVCGDEGCNKTNKKGITSIAEHIIGGHCPESEWDLIGSEDKAICVVYRVSVACPHFLAWLDYLLRDCIRSLRSEWKQRGGRVE